jgi:pimeloyl-ACP methyl ester carboxylesterase
MEITLIVLGVVLGLLVLYFGFGFLFFVKFFHRTHKPIKFKDDLSSKYDFSPDLDWFTSPTHQDLSCGEGKRKLKARMIPYPSSHRYLICLHGFKGSYAAHSRMNHALADSLKANAVLLVLRGDLESDWACSSVGNREAEELNAWIAYLKEKDPQATFYLIGVSMGAATILFASDSFGKDVIAAVADSGFSSLKEEIKGVFRKHLGFLTPFFFFPVRVAYRIHFHEGMDQHTDENLKGCPTAFFYIHGSKDTFVPPENMAHHLSVHPGESWMIPDCPHAVGDVVHKDEYYAKVSAF